MTSEKGESKTNKNNSKVKKANEKLEKTNFLHKIFGGLNMSWPVVIGFAIAMGVYTALMAILVPDGNSFHDITATLEWWVLPAILVIVNCKKPLDAALKVFVFFLISQPIVYLLQVPFSYMGWGLFQYYPYWFKVTLCTLPAGFIGWYIKKDEWYSGVILSSMTTLLACTAIVFIRGFGDNFPNHLITVIYCIAIIPVFLFGVFRKWQPRIVAIVITIVAATIFGVVTAGPEEFETYRTSYDGPNGEFVDYEFGENPYVSSWSGGHPGGVEIINAGELGYTLKIKGTIDDTVYHFSVSDDSGAEYNFKYYYDKKSNSLMLEKEE
jgi:hypothetical protein